MKSIVVVHAKGDSPAEIGGAGGRLKLSTESGILYTGSCGQDKSPAVQRTIQHHPLDVTVL